MTEVPDVYPDFPDDDESGGSDDQGVEGRLAERRPGTAGHRATSCAPGTRAWTPYSSR